jgi:hypothetical protein
MASVLHGARSIVNYAPISTHCIGVLAAMILIIGLDGMGGTMDAVSYSRIFTMMIEATAWGGNTCMTPYAG